MEICCTPSAFIPTLKEGAVIPEARVGKALLLPMGLNVVAPVSTIHSLKNSRVLAASTA